MNVNTQTKSIKASTAMVTGAASGIGREYARQLAARGHPLLLVDRQAEQLRAFAADVTSSADSSVETLVADLAVEADLEAVSERLTTDTTIDMLINNAGTSKVAPLVQLTWADVESMIQVNISAVLRLTLAVLPRFVAQDGGTLINVGSAAGFFSYTGSVVYCGTKAFTLNFTRGIQQELAGTGVTVQLVAPSATVSGIWETAGVPLSSLDPAMVMSTENCVAASLRGLDLNEPTTVPALSDPRPLQVFEEAASALLAAATRTGTPAPRYLD